MIRIANKKDIIPISELWTDMVGELMPEWKPDQKSWIETGFLLMDTGSYYIVIAEDDDGNILGFLDGMAYFEPGIGKTIGVAKHFYLKPEFRKTGLMSRMYAEMVSIAESKGVEVIELQCYPDRLEYWQAFGFKRDQHILRMVI